MSGKKLTDSHTYLNGPSRPCGDCGLPLVLKCGSIKRAHYAHLPSKYASAGCNGGESATHHYAKLAISEHLSKGGHIVVNQKCARCSTLHEILLELHTESSILEVQVEYSLSPKAIVDIAILDDGVVKCLIEVFQTHRTLSGTDRDIYKWYEISAQEILFHWQHESDVWMVDDMRLLDSFSENIAKCDSTRCVSRLEIATQLAIYERYYSNMILRDVAIAACGYYKKYTFPWRIPDYEEDLKTAPLWVRKEMVRRKECVRCGDYHAESSYVKPYCYSCFRITRDENSRNDENETIQVQALATEREYQRLRFLWLQNVPKWDQGSKCRYCQLDSCSNSGEQSSYIFFYGKRNVCEQCFVSRQTEFDQIASTVDDL